MRQGEIREYMIYPGIAWTEYMPEGTRIVGVGISSGGMPVMFARVPLKDGDDGPGWSRKFTTVTTWQKVDAGIEYVGSYLDKDVGQAVHVVEII